MKLYHLNLVIYIASIGIYGKNYDQFAIKVTNHNWLMPNTKIRYFVNQKQVGEISHTKIPFLSWYALHSLYVDPKYRQRGYAKQLLQYACQCLQKKGATKIYIQPGPYEIQVKLETIGTREAKIQRLVQLYQTQKFTVVNKIISDCAKVIYKIIGIPEDAQYLLVRHFND